MGSLLSKDDSLWFQSFFAVGVAVLILTTARVVGAANEYGGIGAVFVHSLIAVSVCYSFATLIASTTMKVFGEHVPLWLCGIAGCIAAAVPVSLVAPIFSWVLGVLPVDWPVGETRSDLLAYMGEKLPFIFFAYATLGTSLWMLLNFRWWVRRLELGVDPAGNPRIPHEADQEHAASLVNLLPASKRGRLLALSAELHYVRVQTEAGHDLVLMPFSDAISPFSDRIGMRIHRSHWVRRDAVHNLETSGSGLKVRLANGHLLPVSRSYSGAVRESWSHMAGAERLP